MENGVLALDFFIKATPATSRANKREHYSRCLPGEDEGRPMHLASQTNRPEQPGFRFHKVMSFSV